eukprot:CAMPEP_0197317948 /NCGR_PEP_ID=MMETSP0891-20130614/49157_1 /TAXON_ID=44058 ORGANISM="Aureoumbra lagunensis, Strain CCMP1510" /NCGR_SAMPLE_ID=MMETSP0891 /ASSEMBLY_ACC=CAM_ASM_000534 /LENGTH=430 /DNA_ID=CAMNT_0042808167 /DNA_START=356 /DNA_END=1648 /DNA_ORIENTATION=+
MIFHDRLFEFRTLSASSFTLLRSLLGDFDFASLRDAEIFWGPVFFIVFVSLANFVILNTVIAIIADSYQEVDIEMKNDATELHAKGLRPDAQARELIAETKAIASEFFNSLIPARRISRRLSAIAKATDGEINKKRNSSLLPLPNSFRSLGRLKVFALHDENDDEVSGNEQKEREQHHPASTQPLSKARAQSLGGDDTSSISSSEDEQENKINNIPHQDSSQQKELCHPAHQEMRKKRKKATAMANLSAARLSPALQIEKLANLTRKIEQIDPTFFSRLVDASDYDLENIATILASAIRENISEDNDLSIEQPARKSRMFSAKKRPQTCTSNDDVQQRHHFSRTSFIFKKTNNSAVSPTPLDSNKLQVPSAATSSPIETLSKQNIYTFEKSQQAQDSKRQIDDDNIPTYDDLFFESVLPGLITPRDDNSK